LIAVTATVFIIWFHRAYRNLGSLGVAQLRWGTGWAVGGWFVPLLNFVRPKSIANDIWRGSDPAASTEVADFEPQGPVPWFHNLWWIVVRRGDTVQPYRLPTCPRRGDLLAEITADRSEIERRLPQPAGLEAAALAEAMRPKILRRTLNGPITMR
jgi:hypothetical protein